MTRDEATQLAVKRILDSQPILVGVAPAAEEIPGLRRNLILHAGPPITWDRMSGPLRGGDIAGQHSAGPAQDEAAALGLVENQRQPVGPRHHSCVVGSMV